MSASGDLIIGVSGVRGVVGEGLTPGVAARFASAMGTYCGGGSVVVGRDTRPSGNALKDVVTSGLLSIGCEVIDVGVCPTPTVQLAVKEHEAAGGVIITASHNPAEYNGLKFVSPRGIFLTAEEGARLRRIYEAGSFLAPEAGVSDTREDTEAAARHVQKILGLSWIDVGRVQARGFKVVLDAGHGTGGIVGGPLLKALGCEVVLLEGDPTGEFTRGLEPVPENLGALSAKVVEEAADVGFATDPDGDRLSIVTEDGVAIGEEYSMVFAAELVLSRAGGGTVVTNLSTSRMVEKVAGRRGGRVVRTPVGEVHVSVRMMEEGAVVGGEGNGGVILPEIHLGRDAGVGMALALELLVSRGCSVSEIVAGLPRYEMIKKKAPVDESVSKNLARVLSPLTAGAELETSDGLKASWPDGWLHVRKSGTEPVVRVVAEAESRTRAESLVEEALELLRGN